MAYCTIDDMKVRFGEQEIIRLSDRGLQKQNVVNEPLVQAKIDDACAEMNVILSCAYDICKLSQFIVDGYSFPALKHWNSDIARKHLYDSIRLNVNAGHKDHKAQSEYEDYELEIKDLCKTGELMSIKDGICSIFPKKKSGSFFITGSSPACIPKICCDEECSCC